MGVIHQQPSSRYHRPSSRAELAALLQGQLHGTDAPLGVLAAPETAQSADIVCVLREKTALGAALASSAGVLVVLADTPLETNKALIRVPDVDMAWLELLRLYNLPLEDMGIDPSAKIHPSAKIGAEVQIGAFVIIEKDAVIGAGSIIGAHCVVGQRSSLGAGCLLHEHVIVRHDCQLGNGVLVQSGAVIGADGFGFHRTTTGFIRQEQIGGVEIADAVEIGASSVIDRGTLEPTRIGRGTKIGPACVVAHNCQLGENVILIGQVGLTGSVDIGDNAVLWGQTGTIGHVSIGKGAVLTACSSLSKNLPDGEVWRGQPAQPIREQLKFEAQMRRVEDYEKRIKKLETSLT